MKVVLDSESSDDFSMYLAVQQGTVSGLLLFLCNINDLPDCVKSQAKSFVNDCLLYQTIPLMYKVVNYLNGIRWL